MLCVLNVFASSFSSSHRNRSLNRFTSIVPSVHLRSVAITRLYDALAQSRNQSTAKEAYSPSAMAANEMILLCITPACALSGSVIEWVIVCVYVYVC